MKIAIKYEEYYKEIKWNDKIEHFNHAVNSLNKRCDADHPCLQLSKIDPPPDGFGAGYLVTGKDGAKVPTTKKALGEAILGLINNPEKPNRFSVEFIQNTPTVTATQNTYQGQQQTTEPPYDITVIDAGELAIMDEFGEKIEALGAMMPPELRPVLVKYVETSVDTKDFTYAQKLAVANNIFTTRTRIGQDGFYYFTSRGNLQMSWGYGLLNKIARYMDKRSGGTGHVEFIEEIPTADEIKKYSGGGTLVKLRMLSSSVRNSHHESVKQYQESFRAFVSITGDIKTAKEMTDELYPHVKNQAGVVGYGSAKTAPNGWTLHDQATKLAMKNLIKRNFNMPGRNDWPLITGGEIGNMSDEQYAKFLVDNEEFLGYKKIGNDELNIVAADQKRLMESKEKMEAMTEDERKAKFEKNVNDMRGSDEPID